MSFLGALDRSISQTGTLPPYSLVQQQLKCIEERVKLIEMKVETAISSIGNVADAIDRNYMRLNEVLDAISDPPLNSQQNVGGLSAQLRDIQDFLQKGSSNRVASRSKIGAEVESSRKATAITEQAQPLKSKKKDPEQEFSYEILEMSGSSDEDEIQQDKKKEPEPEFSYEISEMSESSDEHEIKQVEKAEKKRLSSSSSISSDEGSIREKISAKNPVKNPVKKPVDVQISSAESTISEGSEKSASKIRDKKTTAFNQAGQNTEQTTQIKQVSSTLSPIIQEPAKHRPSPIVQEPAKRLPSPIIQKPVNIFDEELIAAPSKKPIKPVREDSTKRISFNDIDFCEWNRTTRKIDPMGQGILDFQASKRKVLVKFTSYDTLINYWMKSGAKWKTIGDKNDSVMFHCREDPEGNGPVKTMLANFSDSSTAESLTRFFEENCKEESTF